MIEKIITPVVWWLVVILGCAVVGLSSWIWLHYRSADPAYIRSVTPTVTQLERIGELAATRVHVTDVLYAEGEGYRGSWLINGDALLSCDMSKGTLIDVDSEARTATIRMPPLRVISARVNHDKTKTWSVEKTTWLPWRWGDQGVMRDAAMFHAQQLVETSAGSECHLGPARAHTELLIERAYQFIEWNVIIQWE